MLMHVQLLKAMYNNLFTTGSEGLVDQHTTVRSTGAIIFNKVCPSRASRHVPGWIHWTECSLTAEVHESIIRVYKVSPGSKAASGAVSVTRLPVTAKQSRQPFAGSEASFQLLPNGQNQLQHSRHCQGLALLSC